MAIRIKIPAPLLSWAFLLGCLAPAHGQFQEGETVQFQWGAEQIQGSVRAAFGDQLVVQFEAQGKQETLNIRAENAQPYAVDDPDAKLNPPRIQAGDFVQNYLDPNFTGKVKQFDGAHAVILATVGGQLVERTAFIDSLVKLDVPTDANDTSAATPASVPGIRQWVDSTGKFKVDALLIAVRNGQVILRKTDSSKNISLPISKLSAADQDFVATLDIRQVDFTPPADMTPMTTCVSLNEKAAVLGYGNGFHPPITKLVLLDLQSKNSFRTVDIPQLDDGMCLAVSDDGRYVLTRHKQIDRFDAETKKQDVSWYLTIWNCADPTARPLRQFDTSPTSMYVHDATWIDEKHLLSGQSNGKVNLWKVENDQVDTVYAKTLGEPSVMRVFAISPNGKLFAIENARKEQVEIYTSRDFKLLRKVPTAVSAVEAISLTNSMLVGTTVSGISVAWDLKENKMFGQARMDRGGRLHVGSAFASLLPLSGQHALYVRRPFRLADERAIYDFATAQLYQLESPEVLAAGQGRRIWYPTHDGFGHHRYQAFTIPRQLDGPVTAPGYEK